jgi:hypothetical protein
LRLEELVMKLISICRQMKQPVLTIAILGLLFLGQGAAPANAAAGSWVVQQVKTQRCDGNRVMHEATHRYRMFYDYPYAAQQKMEAATREYRMFYDYPYAAAQRMAAATDAYCAGHP